MRLAKPLMAASGINVLQQLPCFADPFSVVVSKKDKIKKVSSRGGDDVAEAFKTLVFPVLWGWGHGCTHVL
jgi:hypothetical protein